MQKERSKTVAMLLSNPATYDQRPLKEAHSLASRGYSVVIFAWDREDTTKRDTNFSDGVEIKRMRLFAGHGTPLLTVPRLFIFYTWCAIHLAASRFAVVHCHDVDTLPVGIWVKTFKVRGSKLVYDMHDLPEVFLRFFPMTKFLQSVFLASSKKLADLVVVVNDGFVEYLVPIGFKKSSLVVVMNAPRLAEGRRRERGPGPLQVLYYGGLEEERGVHLLVEALGGAAGVELTLAGRGHLASWLKSVQDRQSNVEFAGWLSMERLKPLIDRADLVPYLYDPATPNARLATPGKFLTALSLSVPALVPSESFQAGVVDKFGCGLSVPWGSAPAIRAAVEKLSADPAFYKAMAESAYRAFASSLNWEIMESRLSKAYELLVGQQ
jgi:glycosyltransferase involved in cell wall biosynthesis